MGLRLNIRLEGSLLAYIKIRSVLRDNFLEAQQGDKEIRNIKEKVNQGMKIPFQISPKRLVIIGKRI